MQYLAGKSFVYRDLAARNITVAGHGLIGNIAVCLELGTSAHSAHTENLSTTFSFTGNEAGGPWVLPSPSSGLPHA